MSDAARFWDERYAAPGFAYGEAPNDLLAEVEPALARASRVLCLAEGEGRNAVFLATRGHAVHAVDVSRVGLEKATALAARRGVSITTEVADLATYALAEGAWDAIVAIWMHLPPPLRAKVHAACVRGLAPGGAFVLEAYRPEQLAFGTGGPRDLALLVAPDALRDEFSGLSLERFEAVERDVQEGPFHAGTSAVIRVLGRAPGASRTAGG